MRRARIDREQFRPARNFYSNLHSVPGLRRSHALSPPIARVFACTCACDIAHRARDKRWISPFHKFSRTSVEVIGSILSLDGRREKERGEREEAGRERERGQSACRKRFSITNFDRRRRRIDGDVMMHRSAKLREVARPAISRVIAHTIRF